MNPLEQLINGFIHCNTLEQILCIRVHHLSDNCVWQVEVRIRDHVLWGERGSNGKQMVAGLVPALRAEFGRGCSAQHLRRCLRPAATFPDEAKLSAVQRQLNWTHLKTAIYIEDPFKRNIYLELCPQCEGWFTQRLGERIKSMFHERTTISKKTEIGSERLDGTKRTPVNIDLSITNPQHREYSSN